MIPVRTRLYEDEDFGQVVEIAVDHLARERSEAEGYIRWASRERELHDAAQIFVTEVDDKVVGFLLLEWGATSWNRTGEIGWLAVLPEYQRKGLGSRLMMVMEQYAEKKDLRKIYVEPSVENKTAIHFYVENGYKPEAMRKDWYRDGEDSLILGKRLSRGFRNEGS